MTASEGSCSYCGEVFVLVRDHRKPFPEAWWFDVYHDHEQDPPVWTGVLHHRPPRGKYLKAAKDLTEKRDKARSKAYKQRVEQRRIEKASQ